MRERSVPPLLQAKEVPRVLAVVSLRNGSELIMIAGGTKNVWQVLGIAGGTKNGWQVLALALFLARADGS